MVNIKLQAILSLLHLIPDAAEYALKIKENVKIMKDIPNRFKRGPWGILMEAKKTD